MRRRGRRRGARHVRVKICSALWLAVTLAPMKSLCLGVVLLSATAWASPTNELIAHYRLDIDGADSLGLNPPATLKNASIVEGALFLNGRYENSGVAKGYRATFPVATMKYDSLTVALDFFPLGLSPNRTLNVVERKLNFLTFGWYWGRFGSDRSDNATIVAGGTSYRWLGFRCETNNLQLTLNNQAFAHSFSGTPVALKRWHNLVCSLDLSRRKIITMLDGRLLETIALPDDFALNVVGSEAESKDREFSFANYSNGSAYYGYAANLKVFRRALSEPELAALFLESASERAILKSHDPGLWPVAGAVVAMLAVGLLLLVVMLNRKRRRLV